MSGKNKIYVTAPESILETDWMNLFRQKLSMAFLRTCGKNIEFLFKTSETTDWNSLINQAKFFIPILAIDDNSDEHYLNELYSISDKLLKKKNDIQNQLFKVCLGPSNHIQQPAIFKSLYGYNFFEYFGRKETITVLDFNKKEHSVEAWNLLLDLAFDFKQTLETFEPETENDKKKNKYVYLTLCSSDLTATRDELKRELQHYGYTVLPKTDLSLEPEELYDLVSKNLEKCAYVVQLLGGKYGEIEQGEKESIFEKEHHAISSIQKNMPSIRRLIWVPETLKRKEHRQELFINRIKQRDSDHHTEVIESSLDEFKDILAQRLVFGNAAPQTDSAKGEIYLITPPNTNFDNYSDIAESLNIKFATIDQTNQENLYHQHLKLLSNSSNILILWVNKDHFWLRSKLSDLVKAPGFGRKDPYENIGILANGTAPDLASFSSWLPDIKIIPYDNSTELKSFLQKITE